MRIRKQNRLEDSQALDDYLVEDLVNDSVSYLTCVVVRFSEDCYDGRHKDDLVEIGLYIFT